MTSIVSSNLKRKEFEKIAYFYKEKNIVYLHNLNNITNVNRFFEFEEDNFRINEHIYNLIGKENICIENLIVIDDILNKYLKDEPVYWQETSFTYLIYKKGQINMLKQEIESYKNNF